MSTQDHKAAAHKMLNLAVLMDRIDGDQGLDPGSKSKWKTALRGLARGAQRSPALMPADPVKFGHAMQRAGASRHHAKVSQVTWGQYQTTYRAACAHFGLMVRPARQCAPRSQAWEELLLIRH